MLTERQLLILSVTVDDFIQSAQPVGSSQLSKKSELPYSSATIRNEMAELEGMGFLEKTHTSSGRVPSEKGYRFYVDNMLTPRPLPLEDIEQLRSIFDSRLSEAEEVIRRSAMILSELTNYTAVLLGPEIGKHTIRRLSIVPLTADSALALIVTDTGHVEKRIFDIPQGLDPSNIEKMINILNDRLAGVALSDLQFRLEEEVLAVFRQHIDRYTELFASLQKAVVVSNDNNVFYGGKLNILNQPDFHDLHKIRDLMGVFEGSKLLPAILSAGGPGIQIRIGSENSLAAMEDCSIVTVSYDIGQDQSGSIAIVGPKRMDYKRIVTILDTLSGDLSKQLTRMIHGK